MKTIICADSLSKTKIEYTDSFIDLWFNKFNTKYFGGKLDDIKLSWDNSIDCNGCFVFSVDVFGKKVIPRCINLKNSNISSFDYFRNVLVHEMLHYYADCYLLSSDDSSWMEAVKLKMTKGEEGGEYLDVLYLGRNKCHEGNWLKVANQLNSKYDELNITAFGDKDSGLMYDNSKMDYANAHLMCVKFRDNETNTEKEKYKSYTKEKFDEVVKHIKEYRAKGTKSRIEYYFYDLELDKDKLAVTGFDESLGKEAFNEEYMRYLRNSGVIKKRVTFLGKTDNYRNFSVV